MYVLKQRLIDNLAGMNEAKCQVESGRPNKAAVALVISDADDPKLTLCVKASHLRKHAGEVSLPGGKQEHLDQDLLSTALRELKEETGILLDPSNCVGSLPALESLHRLQVTPFVFWADSPQKGIPGDSEIARIFQLPLSFLVDTPPHLDLSENRTRSPEMMPRWHYRGEVIWGLTGLILQDFLAQGLGCQLKLLGFRDAKL